MRQVSGAVQARQSVREIHPGKPQERQRRVLQAQEQPAAGGVGAHDGIVQLLRSALQCCSSAQIGGAIFFFSKNHRTTR